MDVVSRLPATNCIRIGLCLWLLAMPIFSMASECKIFLVTKSELNQVRTAQADIRSLSRTLNLALKSSVDFLNKVDRMTYGLASAVLLGGHTLESIQPVEWNKLQVTGSLLFQDQPFNVVPLRGAKMVFSNGEKSVDLITGTHGEFAGYFFELVPYSRIRLFPGLILERREGFKPTLKMPLTISVESKTCIAKTVIEHVPLEPVSVIATVESNP